jgi:hypothetical protein
MNVLLHNARAAGVPVAVVDMEQHKHRNYPDVLIEVLIDALDRLTPPVQRFRPWRHLSLRRRLRRTVRELRVILADPNQISSAVTRESSGESKARAAANVSRTGVSGEIGLSRSMQSSRRLSGEEAATKIERMRSLAVTISTLFADLVRATSAGRSLIIVDDFYFIATEHQPLVMDYLHAVCKGTGIWLKIGGVGTRMNLYQEGDPPIGVQVDQDVSRLELDVTLEQFATAKTFLEQVLNGALQSHGLKTQNLLNVGARDRIVLACGGAVARDYINLALDALDYAIERVTKDGSPPERFKVNTEDVNRAARKRISQKEEEDLKADAASDAASLRRRWQDIQAFAGSRDRTNIVLFRQEDLSDTAWGKEVAQLENLRLLHRIGVAVPNAKTLRQVRVVIMMIDLAAVVNQRLSMNIIEFWKGTREFDKLRRAQWVYDPAWNEAVTASGAPAPVQRSEPKERRASGDPGLW